MSASACVGAVDNGTPGGDELSEEERAARQSFDMQVMPVLSANCAACHEAMANIDFLKPDPDVYTRVTTWPTLVNFVDPAMSKLLTKGVHEGPSLTPDQATALMGWIQLEQLARGEGGEVVELAPFQPITGVNTVDLGPIGLTGSSLTFRLEPLSTGMYLSEIMVAAGADGATVVHPLFVVWVDGAPQPDPVDRFSTIELAVPPNESRMIGGGTAVLVDVPPTAMLSVHFREVEASGDGAGPDDGSGGDVEGGCADVATFTAMARGPLSTNCVSCHGGGNPAATSATDMTKINDTSAAGQTAACGQILSRVNLADPPNSAIFLAPDPASGTGHDFKFGGSAANFNSFRTALTGWIDQENAP